MTRFLSVAFTLATAMTTQVATMNVLQAQGDATSKPAAKKQEADQVDPAVAKEMLATADAIMAQVAELRGWKWKRPVKKGVHSETQLRKFLDKALEEEYAGGKMAKHEYMLQTMGLLPAKMKLGKTIVDVLMNQVGGFYDPKREAFFMMSKTQAFGKALNGMLIAHELCHALDDQYFGLDPLMEASGGDHDADFAVGSLVEGSATALMTRWFARHAGNFDRAALKEMMAGEAERSRAFFEAPVYFRTLVAKYMLGANFLVKGKGLIAMAQVNPTKNVIVAMKNPPLSSEQILHPEKYWDKEKYDAPVEFTNLPAFNKIFAEEFEAKITFEDCLGEIHCTLLTRKERKTKNIETESQLMNSPRYWTNRASGGWGGDRVYLVNRDGKKGIAWITLWDTEKDTEQFVKRYTRYYQERLGFEIASAGKCAVFCYGSMKGTSKDLLNLVNRTPFTKGKARFRIE